MSNIKATYNAPEGDSAVVTMRGVRFFDGQAVSLDADEHAGLIAKLRTNQHFTVGASKAEKPKESVLKAEHHGGGRFRITHGEEVLASGLSKADADAFNAMSDEDKQAFIEAGKQ